MGLLQLVQPIEEEEDCGRGDGDDFLALKDGEMAWRFVKGNPLYSELLRDPFC